MRTAYSAVLQPRQRQAGWLADRDLGIDWRLGAHTCPHSTSGHTINPSPSARTTRFQSRIVCAMVFANVSNHTHTHVRTSAASRQLKVAHALFNLCKLYAYSRICAQSCPVCQCVSCHNLRKGLRPGPDADAFNSSSAVCVEKRATDHHRSPINSNPLCQCARAYCQHSVFLCCVRL